jgi:hypothetical protein
LLLDVLLGLVWARRRRLREPPELRIETGGTPVKVRRAGRVRKRVAVLVSRPIMEIRVRAALGELTNVFLFTSTWAELRQVVDCGSPAAIFADPLADASGDPVRHLLEFAARGRPVILYTHLGPQLQDIFARLSLEAQYAESRPATGGSSGEALPKVSLGRCGIAPILVHRFYDEPDQFVAAFAAVCEGSGPPFQAA